MADPDKVVAEFEDRLADRIAERLLRAQPDDRPMLSLKATAERLDISERTLTRLVAAGEIQTVRVGDRQKVEPRVVDAYLARHRDGA